MKTSSNHPVTLTTASNEMEAAMIVAALEARDIQARITDEFTAGLLPGTLGSVHVVIRQEDVDRARKALGDIEHLSDDEDLTELTHFDEQGASHMVDIGAKPISHRVARASGLVRMQPATRHLIMDRQLAKGDVLEVARLAGIMAAKRTGDLIPLCHPLPLDTVQIIFKEVGDDGLRIEAIVEVTAKTGVEMEALTAVSVAALTVYDMCKSVDRGMRIEQIQLEEKSGGRSGHFVRS